MYVIGVEVGSVKQTAAPVKIVKKSYPYLHKKDLSKITSYKAILSTFRFTKDLYFPVFNSNLDYRSVSKYKNFETPKPKPYKSPLQIKAALNAKQDLKGDLKGDSKQVAAKFICNNTVIVLPPLAVKVQRLDEWNKNVESFF
jgi:hypothetical protein